MNERTLVSAEWLAEKLGSPLLCLFDCRFELSNPGYGRESYADEHIPTAIFADLEGDLSAPRTSSSGRHPLPAPDRFAAKLRDWGVSEDSQVVVYDDSAGMYAARLWWMLRWLGHDRVAVLDGGLRRWRQLDLPLQELAERPRTGNFMARQRPAMLANIEQVASVVTDNSLRLLDARAPERFRGEMEPLDPIAGHVPGARNHPFMSSVGDDARFLPVERLRYMLDGSLDGATSERTITMCGSGVTACHLLLAMEHADLPGAKLYVGSWSEWSRSRDRPVATGRDR
jgi:thiosulfate/3-mercaptopyruvate sulfurtransferase